MRGEREFTIEIGKTLVVCFIWKNKRKSADRGIEVRENAMVKNIGGTFTE